MSTRQAAELDHAFERNGWRPEDVKKLSEGNNLAAFLEVLHNKANIFPEPFLEFLATVNIPASIETLVVAKRFANSEDSFLNISWLSEYFKKRFYDKVEPPFEGSTLRYADVSFPDVHRGKFSSMQDVYDPIIGKLGGEEKAEVTLQEISSLVREQKNGEAGPLLTDRTSNIFYAEDAWGTLNHIWVNYVAFHWHIDSSPLVDQMLFPHLNGTCGRVFLRCS
jgi:hypothetical protein